MPSEGPHEGKAAEGRQILLKHLNVSRETLDAFDILLELLERWQKRINLVGSATIPYAWERHILDSAQLSRHLPAKSPLLLDLGSGAGFPGLVLGLMMKDRGMGEAHLVEADSRKCAFLREAVRLTQAPVQVHNARIEALDPAEIGAPFPLVTARALKPLPELLSLAFPFTSPDTVCLFLKGQDVEQELTASHKYWNMSVTTAPSISDPRGNILIIEALSRVPSRS